ncbi:MAG: hypothetical protein ACW99F_18730 [Candidatus Hodarchaeales archaeon]
MNFHHMGGIGDIIYSLPTIKALGGGNLYTDFDKVYYFLKPLMEVQSDIDNWFHWRARPFDRIHINLDAFRGIENTARHSGIRKHLAETFADLLELEVNLEEPWLENIEPLHVADIIIGWTNRYHDRKEIDYKLLEPYKHRVWHVGKKYELRHFITDVGLEFPIYDSKSSALLMARAIKGSKLFIGTQSAPFEFDNCRPMGQNGHTYLTEELLEQYCGRP